MPQPIGRDLEDTRARLAEWLRARHADADALRVEGLRGPSDTGFSSDTLMFELHLETAGRATQRDLVVRLEPAGDFLIFPRYDVALQFQMMRALEETAVPVPRMLWLEEDAGPLGAPFYVMEKLVGQVPSDNPPYHQTGWIAELPEAARAELWYSGIEAMAQVHRLDWQRPEFAFIERPRPGERPLEAQLRYWDAYIEWGMQPSRYPLLAEAAAWLRVHQPRNEPTAICWGDSRISNQIFRDNRVIGVIDWEMVFLGNPVADLAWFVTLDRCFTEGIGMAPLPGWPKRAESVAHWERCVGRPAEHLAYYEVFAAYRFSAIMARLFLQMKHLELLPEEADTDKQNLATNVLELTLAQAGG